MRRGEEIWKGFWVPTHYNMRHPVLNSGADVAVAVDRLGNVKGLKKLSVEVVPGVFLRLLLFCKYQLRLPSFLHAVLGMAGSGVRLFLCLLLRKILPLLLG